MSPVPFSGLRPARDDAHAGWVVDALARPPVTVSLRVPRGYEAVVRIHHRVEGHASWSTLLPESSLVAGSPWPPYNTRESPTVQGSVSDQLLQVEGQLADEDVDLLAAELAAAAGVRTVHVGLWNGWGWTSPGSHTMRMSVESVGRRAARRAAREHSALMAPVYDFVARCPTIDWWGGRTMLLFDGPIDALANVGSPWRSSGLTRQCPQWWWPEDRSWFVGTEIDDPCTYVAGPTWLIERVEALPFETVRVLDTDPW